MDKKKLGQKLKYLRHNLNLNEDAMAELLELSSSHIHNIEAGRSSISFETLIKITNLLDIRPDSLLLDNITEIPVYDASLFEEVNTLTKEQISTITNAIDIFLSGREL